MRPPLISLAIVVGLAAADPLNDVHVQKQVSSATPPFPCIRGDVVVSWHPDGRRHFCKETGHGTEETSNDSMAHLPQPARRPKKETSELEVLLVGNNFEQQFPLLGYGGIEAHVEAVASALYNTKVRFRVIVPRIVNRQNHKYPFEILETPTAAPSSSFIREARKIIQRIEPRPDIIWSSSDWSADGLHDLGIPMIVTNEDSGSPRLLNSYPTVTYRFISQNQQDRWCNASAAFDPQFGKTRSCSPGDVGERPYGQAELSSDSPSPCKIQPWLRDQSFTLWAGFPDEEFALELQKESKTLLFVGQLEEAKGLAEFQQLAEWNPDWKFIVYGKGHFIPQHSNVIFKGLLKRGRAHNRAFQRASKFFMFVEWEEAFGRVIVEAMSKGTSVLGSDRGSLPELVPASAGVVSSDLKVLNASLHRDFDPREVFKWAESNFKAEAEVEELMRLSRQIVARHRPSSVVSAKSPAAGESPIADPILSAILSSKE